MNFCWTGCYAVLFDIILSYRISSNNSRGRLFLFSHQKGTIIRGKAIISNISHRKSRPLMRHDLRTGFQCKLSCKPLTTLQANEEGTWD